MELTTNEMMSANQVLGKIMALDMPAKTSYRLMRIGKKLGPEIKTFEEKRFELFKKYGEEVVNNLSKCCKAPIKPEVAEEDKTLCSKCSKECETITNKTGSYKLKEENKEAFDVDMEAIMSETITLDCEPITLDMLGDVKLSTNDMFRLEKIIVEAK